MKGAILLGIYLAVMLVSIVLQTGTATAAGQNVCFNNNGQGCATADSQSINSGVSFTTYGGGRQTGCSLTSGAASFGPLNGQTFTTNTEYTCQASSLTGYPNGFVVWLPISPSGSSACFGCNSFAFPSVSDCGRNCGATPLLTNCAQGSNPQIVGIFFVCTLITGYNPPPPAVGCNSISGFGQNCGNTGISFGFLANPITDVEIAVGVATIAGIAILGSGFSPETIRIIFLAGFFIGIFLAVGAAEGSLTNSAGSLVYNLNLMANGLGTLAFAILSLMYAIGVMLLPAPSGA